MTNIEENCPNTGKKPATKGMNLAVSTANESRHFRETPSLIGCAHGQIYLCNLTVPTIGPQDAHLEDFPVLLWVCACLYRSCNSTHTMEWWPIALSLGE